MAPAADRDEALKRLGGGRWQTRDGRFTIEPQSGTWVVVDAEQTDDLGLALVRGPFSSLRDAKVAIDAARTSAPAESPLTGAAKPRAEPVRRPASTPDAADPGSTAPAAGSARSAKPSNRHAGSGRSSARTTATAPAEPAEPRWLRDLDPGARRTARQLVERLREAGAPDPEGLARRDVVGDVPAAAAFAIARAIRALGPDASPAKVADLLADGRAADLGVRWRVVDGDGRPVVLDSGALER